MKKGITTAESEWRKYRDAHTGMRRALRRREFIHGYYTALEVMQESVDRGWSAEKTLERLRGEA